MQLGLQSVRDNRSAKAVLGAAALSRGDVDPAFAEAGEFLDARKVLTDITNSIGVSPNDDRYENLVQAAVSDRVVAEIMGDTDISDVIDHMGSRGMLPLSSYKVEVDQKLVREFGEKAKYLTKALRSASDFIHLNPVSLPSKNISRGFTVAAIPQDIKSAPFHWLLITAMRWKTGLRILAPFRVLPDVVDLSSAQNPLDVLEAFLDVYGMPFVIEGHTGKSYYRNIEFDRDENSLNIVRPETDNEGTLVTVGATSGLRNTAIGSAIINVKSEVIYSFCANLTKYRADRRKLII